MTVIHHRTRLAMAFIAVLAAWPAYAQDRFYRYENSDGVTVIDDHVPPQFAPKGYSVLSASGRVITVVPRALTDAELNDVNGEAVKARLRLEEEEKQRRFDDTLLTRYSSIEDISSARARRSNEILVQTEMTKGRIANLKTQLEARQAEAASLERQGRDVPPEYGKTIETLRGDIGISEQLLARLRVEKQATALRFDMEARRFAELRPDLVRPRAGNTPR